MGRSRWRAPPSSPLRQSHFPTPATKAKTGPCSAQKLWSTVLKSSDLEAVADGCRDIAERELRVTNPNITFRHDPGGPCLKDDQVWQARLFSLAIDHDHNQDPEHELLVRSLQKMLLARARAAARERMIEGEACKEVMITSDVTIEDAIDRQRDCLIVIDKLVGDVGKELKGSEEECDLVGNIDPLLRDLGQTSTRPPPGFESADRNDSPPSPTHSTSSTLSGHSDDSDMVVETGMRTPTPEPESPTLSPTLSNSVASTMAETPNSPPAQPAHESPSSSGSTSSPSPPPMKRKFPFDRGQGWTTAFEFEDENYIVTAWSEGSTIQQIHDDLVVDRGYASIDPDAGDEPQRGDTLFQMLIWFLDARDFWSEGRFRTMANAKYEDWGKTYKLTELLRVQPHMARYAGSLKDIPRALRVANRNVRSSRARKMTRENERESEGVRKLSTALIESRREIDEWEKRYKAKQEAGLFGGSTHMDVDSESDSDGDDEKMGKIEVKGETEVADNPIGRIVLEDF